MPDDSNLADGIVGSRPSSSSTASNAAPSTAQPAARGGSAAPDPLLDGIVGYQAPAQAPAPVQAQPEPEIPVGPREGHAGDESPIGGEKPGGALKGLDWLTQALFGSGSMLGSILKGRTSSKEELAQQKLTGQPVSGNYPVLDFGAMAQDPITKGVLNSLSGLTAGNQVPMLAAPESRIVSGLFATATVPQIVAKYKDFASAQEKGDDAGMEQAGGEMAAQLLMGSLAAYHAASPGAKPSLNLTPEDKAYITGILQQHLENAARVGDHVGVDEAVQGMAAILPDLTKAEDLKNELTNVRAATGEAKEGVSGSEGQLAGRPVPAQGAEDIHPAEAQSPGEEDLRLNSGITGGEGPADRDTRASTFDLSARGEANQGVLAIALKEFYHALTGEEGWIGGREEAKDEPGVVRIFDEPGGSSLEHMDVSGWRFTGSQENVNHASEAPDIYREIISPSGDETTWVRDNQLTSAQRSHLTGGSGGSRPADRGVTGASPDSEDETPVPVLSTPVDRDLANGGIKVVKAGDDISLVARYLGSLSQSARRLGNPNLTAAAGRIGEATIAIARNTADALRGFRKEVRQPLRPEDWDKVVTLLDDPTVTKGNLPAGTPSKIEDAYNYTRDLLDRHRIAARDAKRQELIIGGLDPTRVKVGIPAMGIAPLVPDDWGIQHGYYVHAFPGNWTVTEMTGVDPKGNPIWEAIDTGWRATTSSDAIAKAEAYLRANPGAQIKVELDNISLPGKGITDKNRLQALHNEIKTASTLIYNGANPDVVAQGLEDVSGKLTYGPRRPAPKTFGPTLEREANLPGWARDMDNFERYIIGMERYLEIAPARAEIFKYRNALAAESNMPKVLKPGELPKRYSGDVANALGRLDASIEALEGYPTGLDSAVRNSLQRLGYDPNLINGMYSTINSIEALLKLGLNPASAGLHLAQTIAATYPVLGEKWTSYGIAQAYASKYDALVHSLGIEATSNLMDIDSYKNYRVGYIKGLTEANTVGQAIKAIAGTAFQDAQSVGLYAFSKGVETARRVAAIGAYNKGLSEGMSPNAARVYARDILFRTQFNYGAPDQPIVLRNLPRPITQFKNFVFKQAEFMYGLRGMEIPRFMVGLGVLGYAGMPFLGAISGLVNWMSSGKVDPENDLKRLFPRFSRGILGYLPGGGIDYTKNIGYSDWLGSHATDPSTFLGPGGSDVANLIKGIAAMAFKGPSRKGEQDIDAAWRNISPEVHRLYDEGIRMARSPDLTDPRTGAVIIKNLTPAERVELLAGFTPLRVSEERDTHEYIRNQIENTKDKRGWFVDRLAETQVELSRPGISAEEKAAQIKRVIELTKQAQGYPEVGPGLAKAVMERAREMQLERLQRDIKMAPKVNRLGAYQEQQRFEGK